MKFGIRESLACLFCASFVMALSLTAAADVLLWEDFAGELDTTVWSPSNPDFIRTENGVLVVDQGGSGGDWVGVSSVEVFSDCVIYYQWTLAEWSGEGDCGGFLRDDPDSDGGYRMRWGWGSNTSVNLVDSVDHPPVGPWQAFPGCSSAYLGTSKHFELKASLVTPIIKVKIGDLDTGQPVANWQYEDDWYDDGNLQFEAWKYGVVNVDNVLVATLDLEAQVFSDGFDPENMEASVDATGKLTGTWGEIKSQ